VHLLVVEDDLTLQGLLRRLLTDDRHVVESAASAREALDVIESGATLDAIVLDVGLPDRSGFELAREIRRSGSAVPVLMLTARDAVEDRVRGLDSGADDYLVKPFAYAELAARLRALSRRATDPGRARPVLTSGPIELDEVRHTVLVAGRPVTLSPREFSLLEHFLRHVGQLFTRNQLLDAVWPYGVAVTPNTVDAYVHLLREKLGPVAGALIDTERGFGYRMREP
jgi:DNA-binding response OmpR family regulator